MTSKEIQIEMDSVANSASQLMDGGRIESAKSHLHELPLWEIALQLALQNERVGGFMGIESPVKEELWPKIERVGSRWALWMSPLAQAQIFETEELAKEHVRTIAQKMNDYVPPKKPSEGLDKTEAGKSGPDGERGGSPALQCPNTKDSGEDCVFCGHPWSEHRQGSRVNEPSSEASAAVPIKELTIQQWVDLGTKVCSLLGVTPRFAEKDDYRELLESARAHIEVEVYRNGAAWERFVKAVGAMRGR